MSELTADELLAHAQTPGGLDMPMVCEGLKEVVGRGVARTLRVPPSVRHEIEAAAFAGLVMVLQGQGFDPDRGTSPGAFMYGVVRNVALAEWRKRRAGFKRMVPLQDAAAELGRLSRSEHPEPEELNRDRLKLMILYEIANPAQREMMGYLKRGWNRAKIAEKLGVPRNRIDQWVCRLRRRTLERLETLSETRE